MRETYSLFGGGSGALQFKEGKKNKTYINIYVKYVKYNTKSMLNNKHKPLEKNVKNVRENTGAELLVVVTYGLVAVIWLFGCLKSAPNLG